MAEVRGAREPRAGKTQSHNLFPALSFSHCCKLRSKSSRPIQVGPYCSPTTLELLKAQHRHTAQSRSSPAAWAMGRGCSRPNCGRTATGHKLRVPQVEPAQASCKGDRFAAVAGQTAANSDGTPGYHRVYPISIAGLRSLWQVHGRKARSESGRPKPVRRLGRIGECRGCWAPVSLKSLT